MESLPNLAESVETRELETAPRKPRRYRCGIHRLAYVNLDHANGGIIRNLSETGIALQAVSPLRVNEQGHVRFELMSPPVCVERLGRVGLADRVGEAGGQFFNFSERTQRILQDR